MQRIENSQPQFSLPSDRVATTAESKLALQVGHFVKATSVQKKFLDSLEVLD